ncbi:fumarate hydratase [Aeromicrobium sp. PE09-221]|uniref:FumA C-terminus/TtdB family hydratase beta subunit n=1 Tax=Aeromicrobium sp. PE09-221 TaxID=1898043 RepID=UPI000B3EDDD1|nr:FumA C-terminus/TtdB family hydratase beta subunit [Aeromicrobium sp. PE09-221]OUZ07335.1 fumarate hydratase [Aeromicrobium sp. PE09-221]
MTEFVHTPLLPRGEDTTEYVTLDMPRPKLSRAAGRTFLTVPGETLTSLAAHAFAEMSHFLRRSHLQQLRSILDDPEASPNDRYVATDLLRNAAVSSGGVLPMCQDTGTAIVMAKRGRHILTDGADDEHISRGIHQTFASLNLRYSQLAPLTMYEERNTGTNLPAQIEIHAEGDASYEFLFMAKGGGSANKSFLFQESKAVLNRADLLRFLTEKIGSLGTAACPPYHLAVVVGGTSAESALKTAKLASARYLDTLPTTGDRTGRGFRDLELEEDILAITRELGLGAQFGGKYFCHDVRVVRLPRHAGSCPIAIAVSCSADRQVLARIDAEGVHLEQLEHDPAQFLPAPTPEALGGEVVEVDLNRSMDEIREQIRPHPVGTRLSLSGPLVVARDLVHAEIRRHLADGGTMPDYLRNHPVYYAGPAKTPEGMVSGSFGPTTAGRMDGYVDEFQAAGGSLVMLAKGNRSPEVARACKRHGGFYLGTVGGPAARIAQDCIASVRVLDFEELGMEAVWLLEVRDFPAFVVVDDRGNDFFAEAAPPLLSIGRRPR